MKISFIVLTYNRADALLAVLASLAAQCGAGHEVVIADDGSNQAQLDLLYKKLPVFDCPVRHVWHPDTGFTASTARNLGAYHANGDYLVFLDGDCVPNQTFAKAHARLAGQGFFVNGSRVLLSQRLTSRVLEQNLPLQSMSAAFWLKCRLAGDSNKLLHLLPWPASLLRVKKDFSWHGIRSCNLGVWKDDFLAVNGFDETFEGWGHEDADLVLRLSHFGIQRKNGFLATEVYHLWHPENQRDRESINKKKVLQRMSGHMIRSEKGLQELVMGDAVKVTHLH